MQVTADILLRAYAIGLFPMAERHDDEELFWVDPQRRGVLPLDGFHLPKRLYRTIRSGRFEVRYNTAFSDVVRACAEPTPERPETWINEEIVRLYAEVHEMGFAHSIECWREGRLVGGLYGVSLVAVFFGESMFTRESDASKVALAHLVARLRLGVFAILDTQFLTEHLAQFGTIEIDRESYRQQLSLGIRRQATFVADPPDERLATELALMREEARLRRD